MPITILHTPRLTDAQRAELLTLLPGELSPGDACMRLRHAAPMLPDVLQTLRARFPFDVSPLPDGFQPEAVRLFVTDMDSTLISIECIDEIADFAGRKAQVAAVTEAAMRGELDFATSLVRRVEALQGLDEAALLRVYEERLTLNPGAEALLAGLRARGIATALVSGGFTFFTDRLRERLDLDFTRANRLEVVDGKLTGRVAGAIVDAEGKADFVREVAERIGATAAQAIAMGDGANDLKMMAAAGLGIAYRAKPKVQAEADVVFNHADLSAVLHLLERTTS